MIKYFTGILLFFIVFNSWSQNDSKIYGRVVDESGEVLAGPLSFIEQMYP